MPAGAGELDLAGGQLGLDELLWRGQRAAT